MSKRKHIKDDGQIAKRPKDSALRYDFMISLQNITMAKVINILWMNESTKRDIVHLFHSGVMPLDSDFEYKISGSDFEYEWQQVENGVISKISELLIPNSVGKALKNVVPHIGNSMLNWIKYHDFCIFGSSKFSKHTAVNLLGNLAWTARGKVDYAKTAKKILYNQDCCLSDDHKYKLACECCLEDEIVEIAPRVVDKSYLEHLDINFYPMVHFWTKRIRSDNTNSYFDGDRSLFETIMGKVILRNHIQLRDTGNEIPIKYLWDRLTEVEKARTMSQFIGSLGNQDLLYSLLTNLDYEQQRGFFKLLSYTQLGGIYEDWLWTDYFLPTVFLILDIMEPDDYFDLIHIILRSGKKNELTHDRCKFIFKQVWKEGSKHLHFLNYEPKYELLVDLTFLLSWEQDMDIVILLLEGLDVKIKRYVTLQYSGIGRCAYLIQNDHWDLVELLIKHTLFSDEDITLLKNAIIYTCGEGILQKFLMQENVDKIDCFVSWFAQGDLEKIEEFKMLFFGICCCEFFIGKFIEENKYDLLDQVLNWLFLNDQQGIVLYKRNIYKHCPLRPVMASLIKSDNSLKKLDKLTGWLFSNEQEVHDFKMWLLFPEEIGFDVCEHLLIEKKLDLLLLIKWFRPSKETTMIYKMLVNEKHYKGKLSILLDEYIESHSNLIEDDLESVLQD